MTKRKVIVSSDQRGLLGGVNDFLAAYRGCEGPLGQKMGIEVISWRHQLGGLVKLAKEGRVEIVGFHGRCGNNGDDWQGKFIDAMLAPLEDLMMLRRGFPEAYILVHDHFGSEIGKADIEGELIMVENSGDSNYLERTFEVVKAIERKGGRPGLMIDLCHLWREVQYDWGRMLELVNRGLEKTGELSGVHLPIGTRKDDSLPIDQFDDSKLRDLAGITKRVEIVVLENQNGGVGMVCPGFCRQEINLRNQRLLFRLKDKGVI